MDHHDCSHFLYYCTVWYCMIKEFMFMFLRNNKAHACIYLPLFRSFALELGNIYREIAELEEEEGRPASRVMSCHTDLHFHPPLNLKILLSDTQNTELTSGSCCPL